MTVWFSDPQISKTLSHSSLSFRSKVTLFKLMMRCFLPCFGTCKRRNQLRSANAIPSDGGHVGEGAFVEEFIDYIAESKIKNEEQSNNSAETKEKQEKTSREEEAPGHEESSESLFSLSICSRKRVSDAEAEVNSPMQLVCAREVPQALEKFSSQEENTKHHKKEEESSAKELDENEGDPVPDDGYDDINLDANRTWVQQESSESLFSLSTDSRIRISSAEEAENEVNSLMPAHATNRITQADVSSVLNPIENLPQGRVVKATVLQSLKNDKENINLDVDNIPISPEPSLKLSNRKARLRFNDKKQEIGVDTSLSSWLVEPETTPISVNSTSSVGEHTPKGRRGSPWSHEDRPILGALTVEEIRMFSISASSRKSRSRSPDETPIIGTVGSYWRHTEQSMDSEFNKSELQEVKPKALQTRLERAFEASVSQV